jgi:hypothetical protein
MSDECFPRRRWQQASRRVATLATAGFLLACSVGLFYVGMLAWGSAGGSSGELRGTPRGMPLFALAMMLAAAGAVVLKTAVRFRTPDE